jgi:hypothetical protein
LQALPGLYADLLDPVRAAGLAGAGTDAPLPLPDAHRQARDAIRLMLGTWARLITADRDLHWASHALISTATKEELRAAVSAWALARTSHRDFDATKHQAAAEQLSRFLATGTHVIAARCQTITAHLDWALADPELADQLVHDIASITSTARALTDRPPSGQRIPCACGTLITVHDTDTMTCTGCGTSGVLTEWIDTAPDLPPMRLTHLREWLATRFLDIPERTLREWADVGRITPISGGGLGRARLYDPRAVYLIALDMNTRSST